MGDGNSANTYAAAGYGIQGFSSIGSAFSQYNAQKLQGEFQANLADFNGKLADLKAADAIARGDKEASLYDKQASVILGAQRASIAGSGVNVDSGSAADIQTDTKRIAAENVLTIKNNAWREAFGYKIAGVNDSFQGQFSSMAANSAANATLLTGGLNFLTNASKAGYQYSQGTSRPTVLDNVDPYRSQSGRPVSY